MSGYRAVDISELTPGSTLAASVFDQYRRKLLGAGAKIDEHLLNEFRSRGITSFLVECDAVATCDDVLDETPLENVDGSQAVKRCGGCRSTIKLRPPILESKATMWLCNVCGAIYFGGDCQESELPGLSQLGPDRTSPFILASSAKQDAFTRTIRAESAHHLTKLLVPEEVTWADRRRHKRYPITVPVVVLPLASDFRVVGDAEKMTTANISLGGAALLYTRYINCPYLAIDFTSGGIEQLQVILKVLRYRSLGPVYDIGGEFISRLSHVPGQT